MQKYISLLILFLSLTICHHTIGQNKIIKTNNAETIIDNYLKSIGGIKKLVKVKTLNKKFTTEILGVSELQIEGELIYQYPNLYYASIIREIADLKQIHETKYNGEICIISQLYNKEKSESRIKGDLLKEKMQDFYPFPILTNKLKNTKFKLLEIQQEKNYKIYKILQDNSVNKDSIFLYFDSEKYFLRKKETINTNTTTIIEYDDFKKQDGIFFPLKEISKIIIDKKNIQSSTTTIHQIIINDKVNINQFQ